MADLGNLYFDVLLRNKTAAEATKIKKDIVDSLKAKLDVTFDKAKLESDVRSAVGSLTGRLNMAIDDAALKRLVRGALHDPFKIDVVVDKASARRAVQDALSKISTWNGKYTADDLRAAKGEAARQVAAARAAEANAKAQLALARAHAQASSQTRNHMKASLGLNGSMRTSVSLAGQLRDQFLSLYSIYAAQGFLRNVIQIGGELEKQQLAMGAILKDASHAGEISGQLKELAIRSPFGVIDLNNFAKQLTAYSIPYNELYDTMKRLADISAGVGVDMGRIVLAYGQIRAAKFLKGTELRQLTEANIPMVDKLSERFSKLEGRVVSAAEVMDMISKKKVTFEDVKDVIWEMTGEGGMFYNMQETLAESVSAKWKNLGDAIDIMYADMASSTSGLLKGTAEALTELVKHWSALAAALGPVIGKYAIVKVASMTSARFLTAEAVAMEKTILADKKKEAENIRLAQTYRKLTVEEKRKIASSTSLRAADLRSLAISGALTKEQVLRMVAMKKLSVAQAGHLRQILGISRAELQAAANAKKWKIQLLSLGTGFANALKGIGSFIAGNWFTIALMGVMEVVNYFNGKSEESKERIESLKQAATESYKALSEQAELYSKQDSAKMKDGELVQSIASMRTLLKDYAADWKEIFAEAFKTDEAGKNVNSLKQQFDILKKSIEETAESMKSLGKRPEWFEEANKKTGNLFNKTMVENAQALSKQWEMVYKKAGEVIDDYDIDELKKAVTAAMASDSTYAFFAKEKDLRTQLYLLKDYNTAYETFMKNMGLKKDFDNEARWLGGYARGSNYLVYTNDLGEDIAAMAAYLKKQWEGLGYDFTNLTSAQIREIRNGVHKYVSEMKNVRQDLKDTIEQKLLGQFGIVVDLTLEDKEFGDQLQGWQNVLDDMTNRSYTISITAAGDITDAIGKMKKDYKEAKETIKETKKILDTNKISTSADPDNIDDDFLRQALIDHNAAKKIVEDGENMLKLYGIDLGETKTSGATKDAVAQALRERLKLLKDAYSEFKKWAELIGEDDAMSKIKGSGIFDALFAGEEPMSPAEYAKSLQTLLDGLDTSTKERRELRVEIQKLLLDIEADEKKRAAESMLKEMEKYISDAAQDWNLYKTIFEATGNEDMAKLAFGDYSMWDKSAMALRDKLIDAMSKKGLSASLIDWNMDEAKALDFFGTNKELLKLYQEIQKKIRENGREYLTASAQAISATMSVEDKIKTLQAKRKALQEQAATNPDLFPEGAAAQIAEIDSQISKLQGDLFELSPLFEQIFGDMTYHTYGFVAQTESTVRELVKNAQAGKRDKNGRPIDYKSFYMSDGELKEVVLTRQQLERLKKQMDEFYNIKIEKNPFRQMVDSLADLRKALNNPDTSPEDKAKAWQQFANSFSKSAAVVGDFCGNLAEMFKAMGKEGMGEAMDYTSEALKSVANIGQGFATGGLWGGIAAAACEAVGWIGKLFNAADERLKKMIKKSQTEVKLLQGVYDVISKLIEKTLGNGKFANLDQVSKDVDRISAINKRLSEIQSNGGNRGYLTEKEFFEDIDLKKEKSKLQRRLREYEKGGAYGYQRILLQEQIEEMRSQRTKQLAMKKKDQDAINELDKQIAEAEIEMRYFAEETANTLYGIDIKDWASQLGDALYDAWKKGEDGAEAFRDKVADIMGSVMNSMLKLTILEPAMEHLRKILFGEDGMSGMFGADFELDERELEQIADYLMGVSSKTDDYYDALDKLNDYMEAKYGVSMKEEQESSGLTKGIQGVTEKTADLLASYINAIRADVSIKREYVRKIAEEFFPSLNIVAQAQLQQLEMIQINTAKNVELVAEIRDIMHVNITPGKGFKIA